MESMNKTAEAMVVRHILEGHNVISEVTRAGRYIVAVLALLINAFIAIAYLVQRCRRPSAVQLSPAGLLVLNLLVADAFVAAVIIVNVATFSARMSAWHHWCGIRLAVSYLAMIGSHLALINVAVDRYFAIVHTLQYRDWMTKTRSVTMLLIGWTAPLTIAVVAAGMTSYDWLPDLVRCSDIRSFKIFLWFGWVPSHVAALICVIVIQCRVYLRLRRHEAETLATNVILRRFSQKSAKILFRVTTIFVLCWGPFDAMLVLIVWWINPTIKAVYDVTLVFAQLSFLVNPIIYSYQTANIRKPVSDLLADLRSAMRKPSDAAAASSTPRPSIAVVGPISKTTSTSSMLTLYTSTTGSQQF